MLSHRASGAPLDDLALARFFAGLEAAPALLLAVSGGPDSTALLHLAVRWRAGFSQGPALHVATVDHGLRPEAAAEAEVVAAAAKRYGVTHATLAWTGPRPTAGIQEKAREARYRLLAGHARAIGASVVLTAHHADDQSETVLMRLGRGSGVAGLAAMRRTVPLADGIALVRPLLDLTKPDLLAICAAEGLPFVADPSNEDPAHQRVRLRRQAGDRRGARARSAGLAAAGAQNGSSEEALEAEVARRLAELRPLAEQGLWRANLAAMPPVAPEIFQRLVGRAVRHVGAAEHVPLERLETLADSLHAAFETRQLFRGTLSGTLLALDADGTLTVALEPPRRRGRPRPD